MVLYEDTRQQAGKHRNIHQYCSRHDIEIIRQALNVGDYQIAGKGNISVDTKYGVPELAMCCFQEHDRFRDECQRAQRCGIQLIILVENEDGIEDLEQVAYWTNPRLAYSDRAINGPQLMKAMKTMQERYGVVFLFCRPAEAAAVIKDLLRGGGEPDA